MKKIIFKKIRNIFAILSLILFVIFTGIIYFIENNKMHNDLNSMMEQVEQLYYKSLTDAQKTKELLKSDFLNRAYAIDFMLEDYPIENCTQSTLNEIKRIMEVDEIHIIDGTGTITLSSDDEYVGLNFINYETTRRFWRLFKNDNIWEYVIEWNGLSIKDQQTKSYIGIRSNSDNYSVIQIGINANKLNNFLKDTSIHSAVEKTVTLKTNAIFIVDESSGELEAITKNNEQTIEFEDVSDQKEFVNELKKYSKISHAQINGTTKYLVTKVINGKILGAYTEASVVYLAILKSIIFAFVGICIVLFSMMAIIQYCLKKYVIGDLVTIESDIQKLMIGNYNVDFNVVHNTEFRKLAQMLNDWRDSYKNKSMRMSRIISSIDNQIAVFECISPIKQNFFSNNIQVILGINDELWDKVKRTPSTFKSYIKSLSLLADSNNNNVIKINDNKYINIISFEQSEAFYGRITDITSEVTSKLKMQEELLGIQEKSETDSLTKLLNRNGLEKCVKESFEQNPKDGVLIIFDLDNFKRVNDSEGHPIGDLVLQNFAKCLKHSFRNDDIIARIGGDEFVVFLKTNIPANTLITKLEDLLKVVRLELSKYYKLYELSTSIGVAYMDEHVDGYEDLYKCADVGLYIAKQSGKDQYYINEQHLRNMKTN
ncbi:GGDEF domain-containing protein [Clostridium sp. Marseille-P299]|uniref:GGDEF domain-containing protein n=1 Tax=Clostridium sp. Marseille-P299 TaxID=1805477 RepID=UPI0008365A86|nr:GGDEF domain-containing protein [Clostridium sp. Marseille-P299]